MLQLMSAASGMSITFHRAFDEVEDHRVALQELKELGFDRVLTSGLSDTAMGGLGVLKDLVQRSEDDVIIMPGGSVRPNNIDKLKSTRAIEFHSSCIPEGGNETDVSLVKLLKSKLS
jgi:copper homeostasis protein